MKNTTLCYIEQDGKYLMLLRNEARMPGGVQVNTGIVLCVSISIVCGR